MRRDELSWHLDWALVAVTLDLTDQPFWLAMKEACNAIGGISVAWNDWTKLPTGAILARQRVWDVPGDVTVNIAPLEAAFTLSELTGGADPFAPLVAALSAPDASPR